MRKCCIIILLLCLPLWGISSVNDSIVKIQDTSFYQYFQLKSDSLFFLKLHKYDTSLQDIHKPDPLLAKGSFYQSLGNIGQAHYNMVFNLKKDAGFIYGLHSLNEYTFLSKNVNYFHVSSPLTELLYQMGPTKEQILDVLHTQNFGERLNAGFRYRVIHAPGMYIQQESRHTNFVIHSDYQSKNRRYGLLGHFIYNYLQNEENGGIANDSLFTQNLESRRDGIPVNLNSAEGRYRNKQLFLQQYYSFSDVFGAKNDTSEKSNGIDLGTFSHAFHYRKISRSYYDDPLSGFYLYIYNDSASSFDTLSHVIVDNKLTWSSNSRVFNEHYPAMAVYFHVNHRYIHIKDQQINHKAQQVIPSFDWSLNIRKRIQLMAHGAYVNGQLNQGDFVFNAGLYYTSDRKFKIGVTLLNQSYEADYIYQHYYGNHFKWDNSFDKVIHKQAGIQLSIAGYHLNGEVNQVINLPYFDLFGQPDQYNNEITLYKAAFKKLFRFGPFTLVNHLVAQYSDTYEYLRLPYLIGRHSFLADFSLFNNALLVQSGLDLNYYTQYHTYAYMPATSVFYFQNTEKTGNYPYVDVFVNLKIQRARIFLKYRNIGSFFNNYNYIITPHYPEQDAKIRFGISWRFHD